MHIEELHMQNFRGFKDLTLKFPPKLAVLIGANGSGKSSILDCIAVFLSVAVTSVRSFRGLYNSEPPNFLASDITNGYDETRNQITISLDSKKLSFALTLTRQSAHSKPAVFLLPLDAVEGGILLPSDGYYEENANLQEFTKEFHRIIYDRFRNNRYDSLPILLHYPTERTVYEIPLGISKDHERNQLVAYDRALTKKVDFADFFIWYRNQEDLENEIRLDQNPKYVDNQLQAVRDAIPSFLPGFASNLRVKRSFPIRITISKQDQELSINQLSSGERNLLAMVADLARRLAIANPGLENPLEGSGVVLIDEIEAHLHPQWQRNIIPNLTKTFPNCQFIVTTHSPQVLSNVKKENVFVLEDFQVWNADAYTFGRDSNSILSELMGVEERPVEIQKQLNNCLHKIDDGKLEEAKALLSDLSDLIGRHDSEIVKAYTLIDFLSRVQ
jgi:predicted ATP-binding protein involved in virulence